MRRKWESRPGDIARPHTSQADRDLIEDRLPDIEDHAEDPVLLHSPEQEAS